MSGHTPGPWKAKGPDGKYDNRRNSWTVYDDLADSSEAAAITLDDGTVVAFAVASANGYFSDEPTDANARLIAAAPELLEAAMDAVAFLGSSFDPSAAEAEMKLNAAIAKATQP